ncbi:MAG: DNA mismatch repair protein MutS [Eubacterium sp.]|nr:DNA mismatch repair protein MutS [Eubacterium sp.]
MIKEYISKVNTIENQIRKERKSYGTLSFFRLVSFFSSVVMIIAGITDNNTIYLLAGIALLVAFIVLLRIHAKIDNRLTGLKARKEVVEGYIARLDGTWGSFPDNGSDFLLNDDTVSRDIDLLGPYSLYQFISLAHTEVGRRKLAETVSLRTISKDKISERYEAVEELSKKADFVEGFESISRRISKRKRRKELQYIEEKKYRLSAVVPFLMVLIPVVNILVITLAVLGLVSPNLILGAFALCLIFTMGCSNIRDKFMYPIHVLGYSSQDFYMLLKEISEEDFESGILKGIKEEVQGKEGLMSAIKKLSALGEADNISFNPLVHMILNGLFGWDMWLTFIAAGWNKKYSGAITKSVDIVGDVEELISLAVISILNKTSRPVVREVGESDVIVDARQIYHPLIGGGRAVANSVKIDRGTTVITGSNMSGKTTFLRTVAINMALAYMGAAVCAEKMELGFMKLFTSMRVMDDVAGGVSTFYAEILRIKEMAEYISDEENKEAPAACFIDEIFKGTNSADRIVGAENAIRKLSLGKGFVIVSTHDFELCELKEADGKEVTNYHFEEYYENDELKFDYKIKDGRCTTRNAKTLLRMAGLMD